LDRGVGAVIHGTQPVEWVPGIEWRDDGRGGVVEHPVTMFHDRCCGILGVCEVTGVLYSVTGRFTIPANSHGDHVRLRTSPWPSAGIPDATVNSHTVVQVVPLWNSYCGCTILGQFFSESWLTRSRYNTKLCNKRKTIFKYYILFIHIDGYCSVSED